MTGSSRFAAGAPGVSGLPKPAWFEREDACLAYSRTGAHAPEKIFYFHGSPGSRLEAFELANTLDPTVFDLVAIDRPGVGHSRFQRRYTLLDHARDVVRLADRLGWNKFGLVGYSGGAATLYSVAALAPERVRFGLDVAGWVPIADAQEVSRQLAPLDRAASSLAGWWPVLAELGFAPLAAAAHARNGGAVVSWIASSLCPEDQVFLGAPENRARLLEIVREAFRQGVRGPARDAALRFRRWGFELQAVKVPILLLHGSEDRLVPYDFALWKARQLERARITRISGAGHLDLHRYAVPKLRDAVLRYPASSVGA